MAKFARFERFYSSQETIYINIDHIVSIREGSEPDSVDITFKGHETITVKGKVGEIINLINYQSNKEL